MKDECERHLKQNSCSVVQHRCWRVPQEPLETLVYLRNTRSQCEKVQFQQSDQQINHDYKFFFRRTTREELQQKHREEERMVLAYISEAVNLQI